MYHEASLVMLLKNVYLQLLDEWEIRDFVSLDTFKAFYVKMKGVDYQFH